ncbi:type II toxin-antitoxin system Phd/YefM family antitoxin [Deinococcus sp. NW-56]|uniref:type II toxin-antitoxin system Phd/YefM family antitoxin n=1 Tax=Deinococcus sp. NW-56 TaxID=2080419 RepID=UPI000CF3D6D9|nr:type II toxin-antitoxin system prevent-host-death family antitoxin [Deinococcus sp. NW-56]
MTRTWKLEEAKTHLSQLVRDAEHEPQVITRHGKPVAVVSAVKEGGLPEQQQPGIEQPGKVAARGPSALDALRGDFDFSDMPEEDWLERDRRTDLRELEL